MYQHYQEQGKLSPRAPVNHSRGMLPGISLTAHQHSQAFLQTEAMFFPQHMILFSFAHNLINNVFI